MNEKLSLVSELINLAKADNRLDDNETGFIKIIGNMIGLQDEEILPLFETPVEFDPQSSELDRILQFHRLVLLMNVDRDVTQEELNYVKDLGIKMGLNTRATNEVLERMYDYENHVIPPDELIAIFRKHMS